MSKSDEKIIQIQAVAELKSDGVVVNDDSILYALTNEGRIFVKGIKELGMPWQSVELPELRWGD